MNSRELEVWVKKSWFWPFLVATINPILNILWRMTYGLKATILYALCIRGEKDSELERTGLKIIHDDKDYSDFATWLLSKIPEELIREEIKKMKDSNSSTSFSTNIIKLLDEDIKLEILRFALNDRNVNTVCGYLKFIPKLTTIFVMLNSPKEAAPLGSQRWHRDWFNHKGINIFTAVTEINEVRGMYSAIGLDAVPRYSEIPVYTNNPDVDIYDRDRVADSLMMEFVNQDAVHNLKGPPGTTALVDSGWIYHKGGYIKDGYRIMIEISYQSEQKPLASVVENVVEALDVGDSDKLNSILNSRVKKYMVKKHRQSHSMGLGWRFLWLARKLTYFKDRG